MRITLTLPVADGEHVDDLRKQLSLCIVPLGAVPEDRTV